MLSDLLEEIVISIVGKPASGIVDLLNTPKYVNEFIIAKKLGVTINQTRNILYKISDYGLVSSVRKKDKKKGWYTYFWRFEILKCLEFLKEHLAKNKKEITEEIVLRKSKVFYVCESCNLEYSEDESLLMDFTCDECGEVFTVKNNSKLIKDLDKALVKIDEKSKVVEAELEKEFLKLGKKKDLEFKKEQKEKDKKKALQKEQRAIKNALKKKDLTKKVSPKKEVSGKKSKSKKVSVKKKSLGKKVISKKKKKSKKKK
ncbi:MAG: hypothetical protein NUV46_04820 [Nanoarchaeota archaeon]|nr:hypothetical protein [Nanoarchaeota archaeon]